MGNKSSKRRSAIEEQYTRPQGLYPHRDLDHRKLRRLILDAKLAPCHPGREEPASELEECPICFLNYPSLNRSKCCRKGVCTECFLQMKSPEAARAMQCPFCKATTYAVEFRGAKSKEERGLEQAEEQKVIEAKIRMQQEEMLAEKERERQRAAGEPVAVSPLAAELAAELHQSSHPSGPPEGVNAQPTVPRPGEPTRPPPGVPSWGLWSHGLRGTRGIEPDSLWLRPGRHASGGIHPSQLSASGNTPDFSSLFLPNGARESDNATGTVLSLSGGSSSGGEDMDLRARRGRGGEPRQGVGQAYASLVEAIARDEAAEGWDGRTRVAPLAPPSRPFPTFQSSPTSDDEEEREWENVMLMEAIWRSLQDEDACRLVETVVPTPSNATVASGSNQSEARPHVEGPRGGEEQSGVERLSVDGGREYAWGDGARHQELSGATVDLERPTRSAATSEGPRGAAALTASGGVESEQTILGRPHNGEAEQIAGKMSSWQDREKGALDGHAEGGLVRRSTQAAGVSFPAQGSRSSDEDLGLQGGMAGTSPEAGARRLRSSEGEASFISDQSVVTWDRPLSSKSEWASLSPVSVGFPSPGSTSADLSSSPNFAATLEQSDGDSGNGDRMESFLFGGNSEEARERCRQQAKDEFLEELRNVPGSFEDQIALALSMSMDGKTAEAGRSGSA